MIEEMELTVPKSKTGSIQYIKVRTFCGSEFIVHNNQVVISLTDTKYGKPVVLQDDDGREFVVLTRKQFNKLTEYHDRKELEEQMAEVGKRLAKGEHYGTMD